jgi:hypothetical protein
MKFLNGSDLCFFIVGNNLDLHISTGNGGMLLSSEDDFGSPDPMAGTIGPIKLNLSVGVRALHLFLQAGKSLPHPSYVRKCQKSLGKLSCQFVFTLDFMMLLLCTAKLLCSLLHSIASLPIVNYFVQHVKIHHLPYRSLSYTKFYNSVNEK